MNVFKYTHLEKVKLRDKYDTYFLACRYNEDFDCDLISGFWFNEFAEKDTVREFICEVNSLDDVIKFMEEKGIDYKNYYDEDAHTLLIGGEHDRILYSDLTHEWLERED